MQQVARAASLGFVRTLSQCCHRLRQPLKGNAQCSVIEEAVLTGGSARTTSPMTEPFTQGRNVGRHAFAGQEPVHGRQQFHAKG